MTAAYADDWEWCREFIDREVIYRADDKNPRIPAKAPGKTYSWQCYMRRATFNAEFARRLGRMFWDRMSHVFKTDPFQLCSCVPSGPPIGMAIQATSPFEVTHFIARRSPKEFGIDNWFDGSPSKLPVLIVDDVAASANHMVHASARIRNHLQLPLHRNYFAIVNKVGRNVSKDAQHTENYLDNELACIFTMNNFCLTAAAFEERYGHRPQWTGLVG